MAELVESLGELKAFPSNIHILCPRQHDDDMTQYNDDILRNEGQNAANVDSEVLTRVTEAKARREMFLSCMQLLAFDADGQVQDEQQWIWKKLEETLEKCDLCIKEYYKGKMWLMGTLHESYEESDVERFNQVIDEWDIRRITKHLDRAGATLRAARPEQRTLAALDRAALLSIFESLSSPAMLKNESVLREHFDEPFKLVQTKRSLKILDYVPATTHFLFSADGFRSHWAAASWVKFTRPPTSSEFEWAIKEPLLGALSAVSIIPIPEDVIFRLWRGMQLIVRRLDKKQITHDLRALEIDPCRLSVDHVAVQTPALRPLLNTIQLFLEKAPNDFWDAMQTISPQAIIEQIFYNPQYNRFLLAASSNDTPEPQTGFDDMLSWIDPFMGSLKGAHQPQACRLLVKQLLARVYDSQFSSQVQYRCLTTTLSVIIHTLRTYTDNEASRGSVGRVILSETLQVITDNINTFLSPPRFLIEGSGKRISSLCMDVIRNTLALECQSLKSDYEVILLNNSLQHGVSTYSPAIWDAVVRQLSEDNVHLSTAALMGILPLVGLEQFNAKHGATEEKKHFNDIYGHLTRLSSQILQHLSDFNARHLEQLFRSPDTNCSLVSTLFSADLDTYQAAVDLLKNLSGQSGRKEAIAYLLEKFTTTTISGFGWSFRRISNMKTFASAPRMVKTGTDIVNILCDSETGILLTSRLNDINEANALKKLWEYLWLSLSTIFECTEKWHQMGNDRKVMLEFCRDVIQFAALLFDQFSVFASALSEFDTSATKSAKEILLQPLNATMRWMVRWLRLKDEYLATTLVELVLKVLRNLSEMHVSLSTDALMFVENVALTSTVRTILTDQEKAELIRALESYYRKPLVPVVKKEDIPPATAAATQTMKQSQITSFAKAPGKAMSPGAPAPAATAQHVENDVSDEALLKMAGVDRSKLKPLPAPKKPVSTPSPLMTKKAEDALSFREKREKEKEEKKKRDMLELSRLRASLRANDPTVNQGSGLAGLNVAVADHKPADSMMVSSESESESTSEDEDEDDLLGGRKSAAKPKSKDPENMTKKVLKQHVPVKKTKIVRSAMDMRARLAPDLSSLHRNLLVWDPFAHKGSDFPPNSDRTDYSLVSSVFATAADYQKTFEPLLMLEAWQSIQSVIEEASFKPYDVKVLSRLTVDMFVELTSVMAPNDVKNLGLGEADLVVLSTSSVPTSESASRCLGRISRCTKKKGMMEITYRVNVSAPLVRELNNTQQVFAVRLTSLTPMEREYGALKALQYYDLSDEIIRAKPSPILRYGMEMLKGIQDNYELNSAQAKAVKSALDNDAFTLIQGPPGSGKTKTICALIGALLTGSAGSSNASGNSSTSTFRPATRTTDKKLLVCAPSNAAVDELVMRLKKGVKTLTSRNQELSIVRLGRSEAINADVLDVTLDELVNRKLNLASSTSRKNSNETDPSTFYEEHKQTCNNLNEVRSRLDQLRSAGSVVPTELEREFEILKQKKAQLSIAIDSARDRNMSAVRDEQVARRRVQQQVINEAHIVCATLSGSGHESFQSMSVEFETVIIDEAAQSIELSALIPLKYGCSKCILVGDPKQLPPTVLSREAARFQYEQSLFVRMQMNHPNDVHLLDTQYRMHPDISRFPSSAFYDGRLKDGDNMAESRQRPWHDSAILGPYRFFDVQGMHSSAARGHSLVNFAEIRVAMSLYNRLVTDFGSKYELSRKIGIITPYKGQLREMKNQFSARYGSSIFDEIDFNTTDAFQGRECEVVIFSCVRASNKGIGFLADIRRMNVGLTRAKSSLWVLGNSQSLVQGQFWNALVKDAQERSVYTDGDVLEVLRTTQVPDIEMVDLSDSAPTPATAQKPAATTTTSSSTAPPGPMLPPAEAPFEFASRSSSASLGRQADSRKSTPSVSSPRMAPMISGPSGGGNGLNDLAMCGYCGSYEHMTQACDNEEAKAASHGRCQRCGDAMHTRQYCTAPRCTRCGDYGHRADSCKSGRQLSKRERSRVVKDEARHESNLRLRAERQRQRQLGDHDRKVPVISVSSSRDNSMINTTTTTNNNHIHNHNNHNNATPTAGPTTIIRPGSHGSSSSRIPPEPGSGGKRKRDFSQTNNDERRGKDARTQGRQFKHGQPPPPSRPSHGSNRNPPPFDPRRAQPPHLQGQGQGQGRGPASGPRPAPGPAPGPVPGPGGPGQDSLPQRPQVKPPPPKKKRRPFAADPFIRPKRR